MRLCLLSGPGSYFRSTPRLVPLLLLHEDEGCRHREIVLLKGEPVVRGFFAIVGSGKEPHQVLGIGIPGIERAAVDDPSNVEVVMQVVVQSDRLANEEVVR